MTSDVFHEISASTSIDGGNGNLTSITYLNFSGINFLYIYNLKI